MKSSNVFQFVILLCFVTSSTFAQEASTLNTKITASSHDCNIVLFANQAEASYQWIDCGSGKDVEGETNRVFEPKKDGTYAVIVKVDSAQGQSECLTVQFEGTGKNTPEEQWDEEPVLGLDIRISPTENEGTLIVEIVGERSGSYRMEIFDVAGKSIKKMPLPRAKNTLLMAGHPKGDYEAKITSSKYGRTTVKFRVE